MYGLNPQLYHSQAGSSIAWSDMAFPLTQVEDVIVPVDGEIRVVGDLKLGLGDGLDLFSRGQGAAEAARPLQAAILKGGYTGPVVFNGDTFDLCTYKSEQLPGIVKAYSGLFEAVARTCIKLIFVRGERDRKLDGYALGEAFRAASTDLAALMRVKCAVCDALRLFAIARPPLAQSAYDALVPGTIYPPFIAVVHGHNSDAKLAKKSHQKPGAKGSEKSQRAAAEAVRRMGDVFRERMGPFGCTGVFTSHGGAFRIATESGDASAAGYRFCYDPYARPLNFVVAETGVCDKSGVSGLSLSVGMDGFMAVVQSIRTAGPFSSDCTSSTGTGIEAPKLNNMQPPTEFELAYDIGSPSW